MCIPAQIVWSRTHLGGQFPRGIISYSVQARSSIIIHYIPNLCHFFCISHMRHERAKLCKNIVDMSDSLNFH